MTTVSIAELGVRASHVCDYTPGMSTISNVGILADKIFLAIGRTLSEWGILSSGYCYANLSVYDLYVEEKPLVRCFLLLVPIVGNILVWSWDYFQFSLSADYMARVKPLILLCKNGNTFVASGDQNNALENYQGVFEAFRDMIKRPSSEQTTCCMDLVKGFQNLDKFEESLACWNKAFFIGSGPLLKRQQEMLWQELAIYLGNLKKVALESQGQYKRDLKEACARLWGRGHLASDAVVFDAIEECPAILEFVGDGLLSNERFMTKAVQASSKALQFADTTIRDRDAVVLEAIKGDPEAFANASDRLKDSEAFALKAVLAHGHALKHASDRLKKKQNVVLEALRGDHAYDEALGGSAFMYADSSLKEDETFVKKAVKVHGCALQHAPKYQDDSDVILEAISLSVQEGVSPELAKRRGRYLAFSFASDKKKQDPKFVLRAVNVNRHALEHAHVVDDKEKRKIALAVIERTPSAYEQIHDELRKESSFALEVLNVNPSAIEYAHPDVLKDRDGFIKKALEHKEELSDTLNKKRLTCVLDAVKAKSPETLNDPSFMGELVAINALALRFAGAEPRKDKAVVKSASVESPSMFKEANDELRKDVDYVKELLQENRDIFKYSQLRGNDDVILVAVMGHPELFALAAPERKKNGDFVKQVAATAPGALAYAHKDLLDNEDYLAELVGAKPAALEFAGETGQSSQKVVMAAIRQKAEVFKFASQTIQESFKAVKAFVLVNNGIFPFVSDEMKDNEEIVRIVYEKNIAVAEQHASKRALKIVTPKDNEGKEEAKE